MAAEPPLFGCIEAGGTKLIAGILAAPDTIVARTRIPTTTPAETLGAAVAWLREQAVPLAAIGIASFGPVALDRGVITLTTKPGWNNTDMVGPFASAFRCPIGFDTDVGGAALGEQRWGAARGADVAVYVTVGTGIGGGAVIGGTVLHGAGHPEMGHIRVARHPDDPDFAGVCRFHGDCLEGLASGPAIQARWGASLSDLAPDHPAHAIIAWYLGQMVVTLRSILAPQRIVIGGGVLATPGLRDALCAAADTLAGGYFTEQADSVVTAPVFGDNAGLVGALALAEDALANR